MLAPWGGSLLYEYVANVALLSVSMFLKNKYQILRYKRYKTRCVVAPNVLYQVCVLSSPFVCSLKNSCPPS